MASSADDYYKDREELDSENQNHSPANMPARSRSNSPARVTRRERSRSPLRRRSRSPRGARKPFRGGNREVRGKECRVYVSNLNYDVKWMELKDVMKKLGTVEHVEIFTDANGRSKGCGVVEYQHSEDAERAIKDLDGFDVLGRKIRLREDNMDDDHYMEQLKTQKEKTKTIQNQRMGQSNSAQMSFGSSGGRSMGGGGQSQLIQMLNSKSGDPIDSTVFVSNLDFDITWQKLKDMFRRAGNCIRCTLAMEDEASRKSKGYGTVQFETPFEALSAIAMFNGMELGVRRRSMSVRLDRKSSVHNVLDQLGVSSGNVTPKTIQQIQQAATLASLNASGLGGALSAISALTSATSYPNLQSSRSNVGGASALGQLAGLSGLSGLQGALSSLLGAGGLGSALSSLGAGSTGVMGGGGGGGYGMSSSSIGSGSQMSSSYDSRGRDSRRSDGGGRYGSSGGDRGGSSAAPGTRVFVRNLPFSVKWQDLKDKFREAGSIGRADIKVNDDGRSKGCGTVTFDSVEAANRAVSLFNKSRLEGRELEVRIDQMNN